MKADFHIHTNFSDGRLSLERIVDQAKKQKLELISVTDHDNYLAWSPMNLALSSVHVPDGFQQHPEYESGVFYSGDLQIVQGIEITSTYCGQEVHIQAQYANENDMRNNFDSHFNAICNARNQRTKVTVDLLNKAGVKITLEDVQNAAGRNAKALHKSHIATAMLEKSKLSEAWRIEHIMKAYLQRGSEYCPPLDIFCSIPSAKDVIEKIRQIRAIPVIAHPGEYSGIDFEEMVDDFMAYSGGILGIESISSKHNDYQNNMFCRVAKDKKALIFCGSDFHGKGYEINEVFGFEFPDQFYSEIKACVDKLND